MMLPSRAVLAVLSFSLAFSSFAAPIPTGSDVEIRFIDSETGYEVAPDYVEVAPDGNPQGRTHYGGEQLARSPRLSVGATPGNFELKVGSSQHRSVSAPLVVENGVKRRIRILLDPLQPVAELQPQRIESLQRADATLFLGFVVDDDSGKPLADVVVESFPSRVKTRTDARGYFELSVPLPAANNVIPVTLSFVKRGYATDLRKNLELWPGGDWTYRVRMKMGDGRVVTDENAERRHPVPVGKARMLDLPETPEAPHPGSLPFRRGEGGVAPSEVSAKGSTSTPQPLASGIKTIRVPNAIRVLLSDDVTIEYVSLQTYGRRSLPSEWISGWGAFTGGSNSLNAGAIANRTYAIGYINVPRGSDHDICATTSCQVFGTTTTTRTDTAIAFTQNYVVVNNSGAIPRGLTEYSSENNSLGFSCGDGYTQPTGGCIYDPVCSGETRFGHGRGMCQWGTAKWATGLKFPGNSTSDSSTLNGQPRQDWKWIVNHYYPTLTLVQGAPLIVGDDVKVIGATVNVRECPGGTITNGIGCALITTKAIGSTGTILAGPVTVTNDGGGFTWYRVQWNDAVTNIGWVAENWLERLLAAPAAPSALVAAPVSISRIDLSWADNSTEEFGFQIERALSSGGPWTNIVNVSTAVTNYSDTSVTIGTTYYYRVRAFNSGGASAYTAVANATAAGAGLPVITVQPTDVAKNFNLSAVLSVTATGNAPLKYQWRRNGSPLANGGKFSGATNSTLTLTGLESADAANFDVIITNNVGSVTSRVASLIVNGVPIFADDFDANTASNWVTNRSSADTRISFNYNYASNGIISAPASVGGTTRGVKFEANMAGGVVAALNISPVGQSFAGDYTLHFDLWMNINGPLPGGGVGSTEFITCGVGTTGDRVQWTGAGTTANGVWFSASGEGGCTDTSATLSDYQAYVATNLQGSSSGVYAAGTAANARGNLNGYYTDAFPGGLTAPSYQQITYAQQTGGLATGTIGFAWRDVRVRKQGSAIEWSIDGVPFATVTGAALAGSNIFIGYWDPFTSISDNTNLSFGLIDNVRVEVAAIAPLLTSQPGSLQKAAGDSATFTAAATGSPSPTYQWRLNGTNLAGANGASLVLTNLSAADAGNYTVIVSNAVNVGVSSNAVLTVNSAPVLTALSNRTVHAGQVVSFVAGASDIDAPPQTLVFSLEPGYPGGVAIDANSGAFSWATSEANLGTTNAISIRVTDSGTPPLSDVKSFNVSVIARPSVGTITPGAGSVTLQWSAIPGVGYRVQYKNTLTDAAWLDLAPDVQATNTTASFTDNAPGGTRFYRISVLNP